tara:strand:- start:183 stop:668 length:486 start_codon:yes stop_codon:yes gene_type:complete
MSINTIDIAIMAFIFGIGIINVKSDFIKNICQTINLALSLILTSLIISNLSLQFTVLNNTQEVIFLSIFALTFMVLLFLIGFLIEFVLEQIDSIKLDIYLEYASNVIFGMIKGFIFIAIILFTLETIPLSVQSKNTLYNKVEKNSLLLKPCYNFKDLLFQN